MIQEWQAEQGAFTPEELAAARAEMAAADAEYLSCHARIDAQNIKPAPVIRTV